MGCGKSTVGRHLSKICKTEFTDLDKFISQSAGMSIPEIFEKYGEAHFRRMETEAIRQICAKDGFICATGGGALINPENAQTARANGTVVYIRPPFEVCYQRIKGDKNRPLAVNSTKQQLKQLYIQRDEFYSKAADITVNKKMPPSKFANYIKQRLEQEGDE